MSRSAKGEEVGATNIFLDPFQPVSLAWPKSFPLRQSGHALHLCPSCHRSVPRLCLGRQSRRDLSRPDGARRVGDGKSGVHLHAAGPCGYGASDSLVLRFRGLLARGPAGRTAPGCQVVGHGAASRGRSGADKPSRSRQGRFEPGAGALACAAARRSDRADLARDCRVQPVAGRRTAVRRNSWRRPPPCMACC